MAKRNAPVIGIVGGVGPYAGLDLNRKIFDNTLTDGNDQDHLEVLLYSTGGRVADRTGWLLQGEGEDPATGLLHALEALERAGATVAAIACNTAHSEKIITPVKQALAARGAGIELVDMIEETGAYLRRLFAATGLSSVRVGLLATEGTIRTGVYDKLRRSEFGEIDLLLPQEKVTGLVHRAIYDRDWGIKARSNPVTARARTDCLAAVNSLAAGGAAAVILGCTELPLALPEPRIGEVLLINPAEVTARALVARAAPDKLKPQPIQAG